MRLVGEIGRTICCDSIGWHRLKTNGLAEKNHSHENRLGNMDYVFLPKFLLEEFIALWKQVEYISPTLSENAKILLNQVRDKIAQIEIQAKPSDRQTTGTYDPRSEEDY